MTKEQDLAIAYLIAETPQDKSKYEKELADLYRRMEKGEYEFKSMPTKEVARRAKLRIDLRGEIEHIPGSPAYEAAKARFQGRVGGSRRTNRAKRRALTQKRRVRK
jgi:hypothetical protein